MIDDKGIMVVPLQEGVPVLYSNLMLSPSSATSLGHIGRVCVCCTSVDLRPVYRPVSQCCLSAASDCGQLHCLSRLHFPDFTLLITIEKLRRFLVPLLQDKQFTSQWHNKKQVLLRFVCLCVHVCVSVFWNSCTASLFYQLLWKSLLCLLYKHMTNLQHLKHGHQCVMVLVDLNILQCKFKMQFTEKNLFEKRHGKENMAPYEGRDLQSVVLHGPK